jgi:hypothetical protein
MKTHGNIKTKSKDIFFSETFPTMVLLADGAAHAHSHIQFREKMSTFRPSLVATSIPKLLLQGNPTSQLQQTVCLKLLHLILIRRYYWASTQKMNWLLYGCFNHHNGADQDVSSDSRHWRGPVCFHYESSLWDGYAKIRVTIRPI